MKNTMDKRRYMLTVLFAFYCMDVVGAERPVCNTNLTTIPINGSPPTHMKYGNCDFNQSNGACSYTEEAVLNDVRWLSSHAGNSYYLSCSQQNRRCAALVSPVLNISTCIKVVCLETVHQLSGSGSIINGSLLHYSVDTRQCFQDETFLNVQSHQIQESAEQLSPKTVTIKSGSYVQIRMQGYTATDPNSTIKLYRISIQEGQCQISDCNFGEQCYWNLSGWNITNQFAVMSTSNTTATMTSNFTRAPRPGQPDCLMFRYRLLGPGSSLVVFLEQADGRNEVVWRLAADSGINDTDWLNGSLPVETKQAYRIKFLGNLSAGLNESTVEIGNMSVKQRSSYTDCVIYPDAASTSIPLNTGTSVTSDSTAAVSYITMVIILASSSVVLFIVVATIVFVVVVYKKTPHRPSSIKKTSTLSTTGFELTLSETRKDSGYSYVETETLTVGNRLFKENPVADSSQTGLGKRSANPQREGDMNVYDLAREDVADYPKDHTKPFTQSLSIPDNYDHFRPMETNRVSPLTTLSSASYSEARIQNDAHITVSGSSLEISPAIPDYDHLGLSAGAVNQAFRGGCLESSAVNDNYDHVGRNDRSGNHQACRTESQGSDLAVCDYDHAGLDDRKG